MPNQVKVTYYGMEGAGRTVTEARKDAGAQIEKALEGDYNPRIVRWREYTVLIWREPKWGWTYRISHPKEQGNAVVERIWPSIVGGEQSYEEIARTVARHIGDIGRPFDEDPALSRPLFDELLRGREFEEAFQGFCYDMKHNYTWQARYRYGRDFLKLQENDVHDWAGMNPARRELWQGSEDMFTKPAWEVK